MLINTYSPRSSRLLAASIVAGTSSPLRSGSSTDARILDVGGWHLSTWREDLRKVTSRGRVTALAVRTLPNERRLPDQEWAQIMGRLANRVGFVNRPWVAVRTSATTVALLTDSSRGPLPVAAARSYVRRVGTRNLVHDDAQPASSGPADRPTPVLGEGESAVDRAQVTLPRGIARLSFVAPPTAEPGGATTALPQSTATSVRRSCTRQ